MLRFYKGLRQRTLGCAVVHTLLLVCIWLTTCICRSEDDWKSLQPMIDSSCIASGSCNGVAAENARCTMICICISVKQECFLCTFLMYHHSYPLNFRLHYYHLSPTKACASIHPTEGEYGHLSIHNLHPCPRPYVMICTHNLRQEGFAALRNLQSFHSLNPEALEHTYDVFPCTNGNLKAIA